MTITRIITPSITDDAVNASKFDETDNYSFTGTVSGAGGGIFESQLLHVQDQKSLSTDGGTSTAGFQTRDLNTVVTNEITGASLSSNQITLPAGTYYCIASSTAIKATNNQLFVRNITDSNATLLVGRSDCIGTSDIDGNSTFVNGRFTISAQKVIDIYHFTNLGLATTGLGRQQPFGSDYNVYTDVQIWKVA